MAGNNLTFSKVVATPTTSAWSQAYSAGSLFAVISLQSDIIPQEDENLNSLGKDVISTLESEFFPLENKNLESIKSAISATISKVEEDVKLSFVVCYLNDNILYLYAAGGGKAILKREEKIGTVIDSDETREVKSASGYVQDKDFIVLETQPFIRTVANPTLASALDKSTPEEISEELAPHVHEKTEGGASAIILNYNQTSAGIAPAAEAIAQTNKDLGESDVNETEEIIENTENIEKTEESGTEIEKPEENTNEVIKTTETIEQVAKAETIENLSEESINQTSTYLTDQKSRRRVPRIGLGGLRRLKRKRLILIIGIIIIVLLLIIGFFLFFNRSDNTEFNEIYSEANAKFDECQSLQELNASLAEEKCKEAQAILIQNQNTFPEGSNEDDQIEALLVQVNNALGSSETDNATSTAVEVDKSESQLLSVAIDNPESEYFTQNEDFIYFINTKGVTKLDKGNSQEEAIIDKSWGEAGGIGVFGSNVYVLDKTDNILKFVPSGDEFSSSDYITSEADLLNSVAMAIDGSIYVLDSSGNIQKYTKGVPEQFSITGLEKSLSGATRITTGEDFENIYVLDKGNSRIVVLSKEGAFQKAYSADILKNARDIDPKEAEGAIFVLSDGKVYKINIE